MKCIPESDLHTEECIKGTARCTTVTLTPALTSMPVIARTKDAVYLRLPQELQRDIGGCSCDICKANPALAKWDTLVVPLKLWNHSYVVHMPDARVSSFQDYVNRKDGTKF